MAKQFVVTEEEFERLLRILELNKFKGGQSLQTNVMIEVDKMLKETASSSTPNMSGGIPQRTVEFIMNDAHKTFLYYVHTWISEMKK